MGGETTRYTLVMRGSNRIFLCCDSLTKLLDQKDVLRRPFAVVAAGICVAERKRQRDRAEWTLTKMGSELLEILTTANKKASAKLRELQHCAACSRDLSAAAFTRKMLTRAPAKRKCIDCTAAPNCQAK